MALVLVTPPTTEPLALSEAKAHLRLEHTEDDDLVRTMISAARAHAEAETGRALITQVFDLYLDCFPAIIEVPRAPLVSVGSITYRDAQGTTTVLAADQYQVDVASQPGRIAPAYGVPWPSTRGTMGDVIVRFTAGYGDATAVPQDIKAAMKLLLAALYENREDFVTGTIATQLPISAERLLGMYRLPGVLFAA